MTTPQASEKQDSRIALVESLEKLPSNPYKDLSTTFAIDYNLCHKYGKYKHIDKIEVPDQDDTHLRLGKCVHKILDEFYPLVKPDFAHENAKEHFEQILFILSQKEWDYKIPNEKKKDLSKMLNNFCDFRVRAWEQLVAKNQQKYFFPLYTERFFHSKRFGMKAVTDVIGKNQKVIFDYKSTSKFPTHLLRKPKTVAEEGQIEKEMFSYTVQAVINALCIYDELGFLPENMHYLFLKHLNNKKHGGILTVKITERRIRKVHRFLMKVANDLSKGNFSKSKNPESCSAFMGCPYKQQCEIEDLCFFRI